MYVVHGLEVNPAIRGDVAGNQNTARQKLTERYLRDSSVADAVYHLRIFTI
jgi:hypothetical protein